MTQCTLFLVVVLTRSGVFQGLFLAEWLRGKIDTIHRFLFVLGVVTHSGVLHSLSGQVALG